MKRQFKTKNLADFIEATQDDIAEFARKTDLSYGYIHGTITDRKRNSKIRKTTLSKIVKAYPKTAQQFFSPETLELLNSIKLSPNFNKNKSTIEKNKAQQTLPFPEISEFTITMSPDDVLSQLKQAINDFEQQRVLIKNLALQLQRAN